MCTNISKYFRNSREKFKSKISSTECWCRKQPTEWLPNANNNDQIADFRDFSTNPVDRLDRSLDERMLHDPKLASKLHDEPPSRSTNLLG